MFRTHGMPGAAGVDAARYSPARVFPWLLPLGSVCLAILLGLPGAIYAPDSFQYRMLAVGQRGLVPAPFSARILGAAIAGWLGRVSGLGADAGFLLLGIACLAALAILIAGYFWSWRAPVGIFVAVFLMPFWVDMFHDYYLPDLLHGALLAALLACLYYGYTKTGLLLLFPAFLARESTILAALCLAVAGWRRIPRGAALLGVLAVLGGKVLSAHYGQASPASVHGLSGGGYILGKFFWSLCRNLLGLPLWSNTLPECNPIWVRVLPVQLGAIRQVGLCQPSLWGPGRLALAWFGVFGLGPAFALSLWRTILLPSAQPIRFWGDPNASTRETILPEGPGPGAILVFRFCLIYGLLSILLTPLLGASVDRLVEYGWPFYLIALPWFICQADGPGGWRAGSLVLLHLATCWLAWFGFRQLETARYVLTGGAVLVSNGVAYFLLQRRWFGY